MKTAMLTTLKRTALALSAFLLIFGSVACTVDQEEEGNLPEYEVEQTEEGGVYRFLIKRA